MVQGWHRQGEGTPHVHVLDDVLVISGKQVGSYTLVEFLCPV